MYIGDKIKKIRKDQKISLMKLSEDSGVQVATLSRIENKKMVGTLESHINIAKVLGIDVTELYRDVSQKTSKDPVQSEPIEIFSHNDSSRVEWLTKDILKKKMMPTLIHIKPKSKTQIEQYKHGTERFAYALKGNYEVILNKKTYIIKKGTSIYFEASSPHQFNNPSKDTISIICITTPSSL